MGGAAREQIGVHLGRADQRVLLDQCKLPLLRRIGPIEAGQRLGDELFGQPLDVLVAVCVFRTNVTTRFGIVTADFGIVTGRSGDVTERVSMLA